MMPAVKHLDPIVGLDVHIVQPPGPVPPVPVPHPYVGMMLDPSDYIPVIGATVYINGLPRVTAGTAGLPVPPHLPIGGMFIKPPTSESQMFLGSQTVVADENPLAYAPLPVLSCQDIGMPAVPRPRKKSLPKSLMLPTTQVIPIPAGPPVLVGGPPSLLSLAADALKGKLKAFALKGVLKRANKSAKLRWLRRKWQKAAVFIHKKARRAMDKAGLDKLGWVGDYLRNRVHRAICSLTGHPVDVATGKVLTEQVDFELGGPIPLKWERVWYSTSRYRGPLGHGWHHLYDGALLVVGDQAVAVRTADGREQAFLPLAPGEEHYDRKEKNTLFRDERGYALRLPDGLIHRFGEVIPGEAQRLVRIEDGAGNNVAFQYDRFGRLAGIVDSCERELTVTTDAQGRIVQIAGPHPTDPQRRAPLVDYAYDAHGNLAEARDPLGVPMRFEYRKHLLVRETNRNGLSFFFEYDGEDASARCVRTWGDGGIYDHKLDYQPGYTVVTNSLGQRTTYFHFGGVVQKTVDARGGVTLTERNGKNELVRETDPVGRSTDYKHDDRGNVVRITHPDGSAVRMKYDDRNRLVSAEDAIGGVWRWRYDAAGRLLERHDPLGRRTAFEYGSRQLRAFVDPAGHRTALGYGPDGLLATVTTPDGAESRWDYDRLGRCVAATDPNGNVQRREHDPAGRVVRVAEPDGNRRELAYDGEGNVVHARDLQHDVRFSYTGMGRLATRSEAGTTVRFHYDTEEQLTAVENEHGHAYRFVLDPTGQVAEEIGFDDIRRRYHRDPAGQVIKVDRPGGLFTEYGYDPAGRVLGVKHSDGSEESYGYRADGELLRATNDTATVLFDRDPLGRIIKEQVGDDWVESTYDLAGFRTQIRSSRGFHELIERNPMGDVLAIKATTAGPLPTTPRSAAPSRPLARRPPPAGLDATAPLPITPGVSEEAPAASPPAPPGAIFEARFTRDKLGLEVERTLPGGVRARWERDKLGRPLKHEIWSGTTFIGAKQYTWEVNDRLRMVVDALRGPTQYQHDALGNLTAAIYEDGHVDLRMPDAVGNLFRTPDRTDRKYGPSGQLLESSGPDGITRYEYDPEGNLTRRAEPGGTTWTYEWNAAGLLTRVIRPDGDAVDLGYDAFARRLQKRFRGNSTKWVWDREVTLHEWSTPVEGQTAWISSTGAGAAAHPPANLAAPLDRPSLGSTKRHGTSSAGHNLTWLFEAEGYAPLAQFHGHSCSGIITDHVGTPIVVVASDGASWSQYSGDIYRGVDSSIDSTYCPSRWQGQYADPDTGLFYNRCRYYDPAVGQYVSQDPIGLRGGLSVYAYVRDPLVYSDPLGLTARCGVAKNWNEFQKRTRSQFKTRSEAGIGWKVYKESSTTTKTLAIGRLPDTEAAEQIGMQRLYLPRPGDWSPEVNDSWVQGGIDARKPFYLATEPTPSNLFNPPGSKHPETVFYREMTQLQRANYTRSGAEMVSP